jgi:hypothetical protein
MKGGARAPFSSDACCCGRRGHDTQVAFATTDSAMIEFRWIVVLTLWTLLIGPILDLTQSAPTAQGTRCKQAAAAKSRNAP